MRKKLGLGAFLVLATVVWAQETVPPGAKLVSFPMHGRILYGFLAVPPGPGPFPAVIWNHGSERFPGWHADLAAFYVGHGFVFFMPHRSGQGRSPGRYVMDEIRAGDASTAVQVHREVNEEVVAAVEWLKQEPEVDPNRVVVSGCSFGGIQTLLTAEKGVGVRAFVAFAPAAKSWANLQLRQLLENAVKNAKAPVFILQAKNDFNTGPVEVLGKVAQKHGGEAKLYPSFGRTEEDGHWAFATTTAGTAVWGEDVLKFIAAALK